MSYKRTPLELLGEGFNDFSLSKALNSRKYGADLAPIWRRFEKWARDFLPVKCKNPLVYQRILMMRVAGLEPARL